MKTTNSSKIEKTDLRVVKTRHAIEGAFCDLLRQMPFEKISVRLIIERAMVSKPTFYCHYQDKYQLAQVVASNVVQEFLDDAMSRLNDSKLQDKGFDPLGSINASVDKMRHELEVLGGLPSSVYDFPNELEVAIGKFLELAQTQLGFRGESKAYATSLLMAFIRFVVSCEGEADFAKYLTGVRDYANFILSWADPPCGVDTER